MYTYQNATLLEITCCGSTPVFTGPAVTRVENVDSRDFYDHDFVPSLRCTCWPSQAQQWLTRKRISDWPSQELIKRCYDSSCLVVPVGRKESSRAMKGKEWRLSFTEPELCLARSLNDKPRQSYILAKLLIKTAIQDLRKTKPFLKQFRMISSYDIKTAMFWLCEKKPTWENMLDDIKLLFEALSNYYKEGVLPDYFIPEKNIIAGISDAELSICLTVLQELREFPLLIIKQCFIDAFGSLFEFDENDSPLLRRIYEEICCFSETNSPTKKLFLLVLMRLLLELFYADLHAQIKEDVNVRMKPCIDNMSGIQLDFMELLDERVLFDIAKLNRYSMSPVSFDRLEYISNFFLESMCNQTIISDLQSDAFTILAVFFNQHVMLANLQYMCRKEIVDFAELVEENIENVMVQKLAENSYGSVENLLQKAADIEDEVEELDWVFSQTAETALRAYYKLMELLNIEEKLDFQCYDEKVIVQICTILNDGAPGILEEECFGTEAARYRLQTLIEKFDKNDLHHR